jgi:cell division protein FtsZ
MPTQRFALGMDRLTCRRACIVEIAEELEQGINIKIAGIGHQGAKAVGKMTNCVKDVEFLLMSEDGAEIVDLSKRGRIRFLDSIAYSSAVGSDITEVGGAAEDPIAEAVRDADLVFIVTGNENQEVTDMLARFVQASRDSGAFTIAVTAGGPGRNGAVSRLEGVFDFHQLSSCADSIMNLSKDCLVPLYEGIQGVFSESALADYLVRHAVGQIVQCLMEQGIICMDFADIKAIFGDGDRTYMGIGLANGPSRGKDAFLKAVQGLSQQGLDITRSNGLLTIVEGSTNMTMDDFDEVSHVLVEMIPEDLNILFGCFFDDALGENMRVTVYASFQHGGIQENAAL